MPQYTTSSRRRSVTLRNNGKNNYSSGVTPVFGKERTLSSENEDHDNDDPEKSKMKREFPFVLRNRCASARISRAILACCVMVAIASVAVGVMVGIYLLVSPPKPEAKIVTIERSRYQNITNNTVLDKIVLGKRPSPSASNSYQPSELEAYFIENGRVLGFDRQVAEKPLSVSPPLSGASTINLLSVFKEIQRLNSAPSFVDYRDPRNTQDMPSGCELWLNPDVTNPEIYEGLQTFRAELEAYDFIMLDWAWEPPKLPGDTSFWSWSWNWNDENPEKREVVDLRDLLDSNTAVCETLEIHPEGLSGIFTSTASLSQLLPKDGSNDGSGGIFLEPFLPPLRHPEFCHNYFGPEKQNEYKTNSARNVEFERLEKIHFLDTGYIVHDFASMCRNQMHKHSRTAFVDIGKPFGFLNGKVSNDPPPSLALLDLYQRFGFVFDHIYGYAGVVPWDPKLALQELPGFLKGAYHDFNAGIDSDRNSYANPFKIISESYQPDDFVVVVLNTNNAQGISTPLAHQLLLQEVERTSKPPFAHNLSDLIDVFYFSHHFTMKEMAFQWKDSMKGASMQDSMEFFTSLREHGIAAHYWV